MRGLEGCIPLFLGLIYLELMHPLETGPLYLFADWPVDDVPSVATGVYTVWKVDEFIYVGMAGRGWTQSDVARKRAIGERR